MNIFKNISKIHIFLGLVFLIGLYQIFKIDFTQSESQTGAYSYHNTGNGIQSKNLNNGFNLEFGNGSFEISSSGNKNAYNLHYQLKGINVSGNALTLSSKPKYLAEDSKLKESHSDFSINYANNQKGLRQDFVINDGPTDEVDIKVNLELKTNLKAEMNDQFSIVMTDSLNKAINIYYKDLIVYDAKGKFLNSEMVLNKSDEGVYNLALIASGRDITYPITVDPLSTSDTGFESTIDSTYTGFAVTGNCDINNDGFCDVVIGSYGFSNNAIKNSGKVDIFLGKISGIDLSGTPDFTILGGTTINKAGFTGLGIGGKFGYSLDCAGDLNNDSYDDIIIGAPGTSLIDTTGGGSDTINQVGAFYIYYGSALGLSLINVDTVYGTQDTMALGYKVAGLGDVNGGGYGDIAVSAPGFDNKKGAVYIYEGRAIGGINRTPINTLLGSDAGEQYGTALSGPGDINGDGLNDILIGAHNYTNNVGTRRDTAAGLAHLFLGNAIISSTPAWQAIGPHKNAQFGYAVSGAGNFDGIGQKDILVGANQFNPIYVTTMPDTILCQSADTSVMTMYNCYGKGKGQGAVFVYSGTNTGLSNTITATLLNESSATGFGSAVAEAGDVDGDGKADIIVGAPFYTKDSIAAQGAVYGFYGKNFVNGEITKADWCVFGQKGNSFLGTSIDRFGGCGNVLDTVGVVLGAYGYNTMGAQSADTLFRGAAFVFKKSTCGLKKYDKPQFISFDSDTIFVDSQAGKCGSNVSFIRPKVGSNCPATLTVLTGIDSSGLFPIGNNTVTFRITSEGIIVDSSFVIVVNDVESPVPFTCTESTVITLPTGSTMMPITWTDPVFTDNHTCSGGTISITQKSGELKNTMLPVGVYPIVYEAKDDAGNVSFCTFRVIISKTSDDGRDCSFQSIVSNTTVSQPTSTDGDVRLTQNLRDYVSLQKGNFGLNLLLSLFEGASGISIPGWIKAALGESGTGINLAFVEVKFNFLPEVDMQFGAYYKLKEATPLALSVNYSGNVCSLKPADKLYGCRDTIPFATSFFVDQNPANTFLKVTPGQLNQTFGVFMRDFVFRWRISFEVSACIGLPLCVPVIGPCLGCLGYRASYSNGVDLFTPIRLLTGPNAIELDLISVCDKSFQQGASILTVFDCLGIDPAGGDSFLKSLLGELPIGPDSNPIDPFFYDLSSDQFVFEPNRIPVLGNKIPEMKLRFGRLTNGETVTDPGFPARILPTEMGPTMLNGPKLMITGREKNLFSAEVDIFSLLYYAIPVQIQQSLACSGIDIGTRTIDIGTPKVKPAAGPKPASCSVPFYAKKISIDVLDINLILRSEYNVNYDYNPTISVESMDLGQPTYWERPSTGQSGTSQIITGVGLDENIKILVPDGQVDPYFISNTFSANGLFNGSESKTQKVDIGVNIIEFLPSLWIPTGIAPLIKLGPFNLLTLGTRTIRSISRNIPVPDFNATVTMIPDDIPPVIACKDTTVYLDANGFAFLDAESVFDRANSYDLPLNGSGKLNIIDVYPDTIYCTDYPATYGYLVIEDDNCNFDTCRFNVFVRDNIIPQIGCVDITVGIGENGTYLLNPNEIAIGVTDNCRDLVVSAAPDIFYCDDVGIPQLVTIFVTDIAGNTNSCQANVTVVDTMPLLLECPFLLNYPVYRNTNDGLCFYTAGLKEFRPHLVAPDCYTVITYELSGATTGTGNSNVNGINFNLGSTTITYTATDASGNFTECSFVVIVEDNEAPEITCPVNITIGTDHDLLNNYDCATNFTWMHPRPVDNCTIIGYKVTYTNPDGTSQTVNLQSRYLSNALSETRNFPLGSTKIDYMAIDTMNNSVACSFTVNVVDDELPTLFCNEVISCQPYVFDGSIDIRPNDVTTFALNVPNNINITDLNVSLAGNALNMGQLSFALRSPAGTVIPLFASLCNNTTTFNLNLDDAAVNAVASASCNPLGNGGTFKPAGLLAGFNGQSSQGIWELLVTNTNLASCGVLTKFSLNICGNSLDLLFNTKVSILADAGRCDFTVLTKEFDPNFTDNCAGTILTHDYIFGPFNTTLQGAFLPLGSTTIIWTATDAAGNIRRCTIVYEVKDRSKPVFINCPEPDVIQDAEPFACGAFVNFALPLAFDDCGGQMNVFQIDDTGLATGSVFPVGMTILTYRAVDASGNSSTCSVRVIVNDTQNGSFACPQNTARSTDPWLCSAVVNGIAPSNIIDNCVQNANISYQIEYPSNSGIITGGGVKDASGDTFQKGISTVTYKMSSQPLLLITEVTQEIAAPVGGMSPVPYTVLTTDDYLELTNFGPASYNVSGLIIERFGSGFSDVWEVPNTTILQAGETLVVHFGNGADIPASHFYNVPCASDLTSSQQAGYVISFKNRVLDVVTTNGYNPLGHSTTTTLTPLNWSGTTGISSNTGGIIRRYSFDNNRGNDWVVASDCYPLTIGTVNPELEVYPSNGTTTALQSIEPHMTSCSFTVTVTDVEAPFCGEITGINTYTGGTVSGGATTCNEGVINVPSSADCIISDINVNLVGTIFGSDSVFVTLTSPSGKTIVLFNKPCPISTDLLVPINITLDDQATQTISANACGTTSWNGSFKPQSTPLLDYYGQKSGGQWVLNVGGLSGSDSYVNITSWSISLTCTSVFQMDNVVINTAPGLCLNEFTWTHPLFFDNCTAGTIAVNYATSDADCVPVGNTLPVYGGQLVTQTFCKGTTTVTYTLTDAEGNVSQCSFTVTVQDADAPNINIAICEDIIVYLSPSECERNINFNTNPANVGTDNCGIVTVTYNPPSGTAFPIGTTTVIVTVTDESGNTSSCSFDVVVVEFAPGSDVFACNALVNISLDQNCTAVITPDIILEGGQYRCYDNYCITVTTISGVPHPNSFDLTDVGQTFIVSISDCLGGGNSCWGYVTIEDKLIPIIICPQDVTLFCGQDSSPKNTGFATLGSCEPNARIYHEDFIESFGQCESPRSITVRHWYLDDGSGNIVRCTQTITVIPITLNEIVWPADVEIDLPLECSDVLDDPTLTEPINTGHPIIGGLLLPLGNQCLISTIKNDEIFPLCGGAYVIARTWKVLNACLPLNADNPRIHIQAIKVFDTTGPILYACPSDTVVSTSPWACFAADVPLPVPGKLEDLCSSVQLQVNIFGGGTAVVTGSLANGTLRISARNLSKGTHLVRYRAVDDCGNATICTFNVTVVDHTPPFAISIRNLVVGLSPGYDASGDPDGQAKLFAESLDNGSFDNCTNIRFEVRRSSGSDCGNLGNIVNATTGVRYNNNLTFSNAFNTTGYNANDTDGGKFVTFCCSDIQSITVDANGDGVLDSLDRGYHEVILRVWDDGNMNGIIGDAGDNYNDTWSYVKVESKSPPVITCPADATIYCDWAIETSTTHTSVNGKDFTKTGLPTAYSTCGNPEISFIDVLSLNQCGIGSISRKFTVKEGSFVRECTQRIFVQPSLADQQWVVIPPSASIIDVDCDGPSEDEIKNNGPRWVGGPCDLIGFNYKVDQFDFEEGVCRKWRVEYNLTNWCDNAVKGPYFKYFIFKDEIAPIFTTCLDTMYVVDGECKWNGQLTKIATDDGGCIPDDPDRWLKWVVIVDLWGDGIPDFEYTSFVPVGDDQSNMRSGNFAAIKDSNGNGIPDIYLAPTRSGSPIPIGSSAGIILPTIEGQSSTHKVTWKVTDGCHNFMTCDEIIMVVDKKAPTPICVPLSTALMADPDDSGPLVSMVELWAIDFIVKASDNCTPEDELIFTFNGVVPQVADKVVFGKVININVPHYFNENGGLAIHPAVSASEIAIRNQYLSGQNGIQLWDPVNRTSAKVWTGEDIVVGDPHTEVEVRVSAWDKLFNTDYCSTSLKLICPSCPGAIVSQVSGIVATEDDLGIKDATISINAAIPEFPKVVLTDTSGSYQVSLLNEFDYEVQASKEGNYLDGVSTLDLVLIQRHILGIQTFDSPYKMIAADVNNNESVSAIDLVELRKLILGIYAKLPSNLSWRFPVKGQNLDLAHPFPYEEVIRLESLNGNSSNKDFVAVKIGDVTGNAIGESLSPGTQVRSKMNYVLNDVNVVKGELIYIPVFATVDHNLFGIQASLALTGMNVKGVISGLVEVTEDIIVLNGNTLKMSKAIPYGLSLHKGDVLFTLVVEAQYNGQLSDMVHQGRDLVSEVYVNDNLETRNLSLEWRKEYLNFDFVSLSPNPWYGSTNLSFDMPESGEVSFEIKDYTGRVVKTETKLYHAGRQMITIPRSDIGHGGVYIYELKLKDKVITGKMILLQ